MKKLEALFNQRTAQFNQSCTDLSAGGMPPATVTAADTALHYTVQLDGVTYEVVHTRNGLYAVWSHATAQVYAGDHPISRACLRAVATFTAPPAHPAS
ncbi:hypothetical protein [Cupriavidus sp. TMH.W2]|uniref:hypothetical protein n=1 Tax=Cupriavidus sp. TMH.W2 TaxID=3434465 RepID=UPI003D76CC22